VAWTTAPSRIVLVHPDTTAYAYRHQNTLITGFSTPPEVETQGAPPLRRNQQLPIGKVHGARMVASLQLTSLANPVRASTTSLTLRHRHFPGTSLIAIGGEVDLATSGQLARYVNRVRRPGDHVVFDLTAGHGLTIPPAAANPQRIRPREIPTWRTARAALAASYTVKTAKRLNKVEPEDRGCQVRDKIVPVRAAPGTDGAGAASRR
jgi:hypothetical protein